MRFLNNILNQLGIKKSDQKKLPSPRIVEKSQVFSSNIELDPLISGYLRTAISSILPKTLRITLEDNDLERDVLNHNFGLEENENIESLLEKALYFFLLEGEFLFIKKPDSKLQFINPKYIEDIFYKSGRVSGFKISSYSKIVSSTNTIFGKNGFSKRGISFFEPIRKSLQEGEIYRKAVLKNANFSAKNLGILAVSDPTRFFDNGKEDVLDSMIDLDDSRFFVLPEGSHGVNLGSQTRITDHFGFLKEIDMRMAAGLNISYPTLKKNFSETNYSSMIHASEKENEYWSRIEKKIYNIFLKPAISFYMESQGFPTDIKIEIFSKNRQTVDKRKAAATFKTEISLGLKTLKDVAAERGQSLDEYVDEIAQVKKAFESKGLIDEYRKFLDIRGDKNDI